MESLTLAPANAALRLNGEGPFKLAFVVATFFEFGGMQRDMLRIARACARLGHQIHIFTGAWDAPPEASLSIHELPIRALSNHGSNDRLTRELHKAVTAAGDFDCVVGFNKLPGLDVYYAGDPCFAARIAREKPWILRMLPRYRAYCRQEAAVFKAGGDTEILLIAHGEAAYFKRHYGTEAERFHLLPPGLNLDRLKAHIPDTENQQSLREEFRLGADGLMILNVGSRFRTKGVDRMVRALAALPEVLRGRSALVVVGADDATPYQRLAYKLGIADRVFFPGPREDVARFYYAADALLHPAYTENTGTTLLEAMACGLPVLTTENCGYSFHVRAAAAGLVCPMPFEQHALDQLLVQILTAAERNAWQSNGPAYCARNDLYSLTEKAAAIIIARAARNRHNRLH
ncbi:MAG: glycosyltransferase family 4 protein [Gammaproteobacteria bacterium]